MSLLDNIIKRAINLNKKFKIKIAFPEAEDSRIREAAKILKKKKICEPVLIHGGFLSGGVTKATELLLENSDFADVSPRFKREMDYKKQALEWVLGKSKADLQEKK